MLSAKSLEQHGALNLVSKNTAEGPHLDLKTQVLSRQMCDMMKSAFEPRQRNPVEQAKRLSGRMHDAQSCRNEPIPDTLSTGKAPTCMSCSLAWTRSRGCFSLHRVSLGIVQGYNLVCNREGCIAEEDGDISWKNWSLQVLGEVTSLRSAGQELGTMLATPADDGCPRPCSRPRPRACGQAAVLSSD